MSLNPSHIRIPNDESQPFITTPSVPDPRQRESSTSTRHPDAARRDDDDDDDDGDDDDDDDGDEVRRPAIGRADARARDAGGTARDDRRHRDRDRPGRGMDARRVCDARRAIERED